MSGNSGPLSDRFDDVSKELYIIATDLDTGSRVVFGREPWRDVPISRAVAASSAVPLLYRPVRIGVNEFVDGAVRGNASLDVAIEAGAQLIVCVNPLVPIDNSGKQDIPLLGPRRTLSQRERCSGSLLAVYAYILTQWSGLSYQTTAPPASRCGYHRDRAPQ